MRSGLREHVSPALLGDHLSLESLIDLGDPVCHREMPVYARSGVRRYLKSIQGFREDFHYRQSPSVRALHLSVAEPMRDILERWCEFSDKPEVEVSLDRVVQGSEIAVIVLPPPSDDLYMMEACASEVVADFARACSAAASSRQRDPGLAVFDHFDRYWSDDLPAMLKAASQAGMGVVIEAENSLNISAMKKATTFVDDSSWGTRRVVTAEWEALVDE
jgi:hypothetical protein